MPRHRRWLLIATTLVAAAVLLLVLPGLAFDDGRQFAFDRAVLLAARGGSIHGIPPGPGWLQQTVIDVTGLGSATVLVLVVVLAAGLLAVGRRWLTFALVLGGTISGSVIVAFVKRAVDRARPELTDHLVRVSSASFPSGHAANSAIVYLTMAMLVVQIVEARAARIYILVAAALIVVAIGSSRVYLGVHWPTDVLAGWAFGALWAIGWWSLGNGLRARRAARVPTTLR